jgi:RNA methyltransferase, TrmH family
MFIFVIVEQPTITKMQIKHIQSLVHKKNREEHHCFVVEGLKNVRDVLYADAKMLQVLELYCTELNILPNAKIISDQQMKQISMLTTATNTLAIVAIPKQGNVNFEDKITLVLDGIQDPGNVGTIIRTAHWFGLKNIVCSLDCADVYGHKVVQATMGSIASITITRCDVVSFLQQHNHIAAFATTLAGKPLQNIDKVQQAFIVMGREGEGIRQQVLLQCQHQIKIEGKGTAESLNVAVAAGIICQQFAG